MHGTSTQQRKARNLLLHMAQDKARALRIKDLKDSRPDLTWEDIAHACDVTPRAAQSWGTTGSIKFENARKLADVFNVTVEYIWSGKDHHDTPDLMGTLAADGAARRIQDTQNEEINLTIAGLLDEFRQAREMRDNQLGRIARQFEDAHAEYLERMVEFERSLGEISRRLDELQAELREIQSERVAEIVELTADRLAARRRDESESKPGE